MERLIKMSLIEIYLEYVNNFITTDRFAEYYEITNEQALGLINRITEIIKQDPVIY